MNKIWIELDEVNSYEKADVQCFLANKMLSRLGIKYATFHATPEQDNQYNSYYLKKDSNGSYTGMQDRGAWFNLDYLSGEEIES